MKKSIWASMSVLLTLPLSGCTPIYARDVVRTRAAKEQRCEESKVQVEELGGNAYRASGCGPETTYVCNFAEVNPQARHVLTCVKEGTEMPKAPGQ